jgi:glyoxylase-like metal-dependent hydrolase (beta-lactamase superfamily II)
MDTPVASQLRYQVKNYTIRQLKLKFSFFRNYTYIIVDISSKEAAIIDPAWELATIVTELNALGVCLTTILLTHSHFDHVNLVEPMVQRFNPQVYMSLKEIDYYKYRCQNLNSTQPFDMIKLGHTNIRILPTPGHTIGSVSFLLSDSLFTGDTIFIEGCGICTTKGGCPENMFDSIQMIKKMVDPEILVYPGHSFGKEPGYSLRHLKEENIYFLIDKKEVFVDFRMRTHQKNFFYFQ